MDNIVLIQIICMIMAVALPHTKTDDDDLSAKFTLSTVNDDETRWGPKPAEEYLYSMEISCLKYLDPLPLRSPWRSTISPTIIHIHNCTLPNIPLVEVFRKLDFDVTNTDKLRLTQSSLPPALPKNYTAGLPFTKLELSNVLNLTRNFFTSVTNLYKMTVENMEMPPLEPTPANMSYVAGTGRILMLILKNATVKRIVNCEFIENLIVKDLNERQISEWPDKCGGRLRTLQLESMLPAAVAKVATITPYLFIESLTVQNCSLVELPLLLMRGLYDAGRRVFRVSLPDNHLEDAAFLKFPRLPDLGTLDLSKNRLSGECLRNILPNVGGGMKGIGKLIFDGNNFTDIFDDFKIKSALVNHSQLSHLSLNWMQLQPDCLRHTRIQWLEYLGLAANSTKAIDILQLHDLPSTRAKQLTVDLRGFGIKSVRIGSKFTENFEDVNQSEHWLTGKGYKLVILLDFVDCDCNNDVLQRALKQYPQHLLMPGLKCNSKTGGLFLEEPPENLNCRKAFVNGCKRKLSRDQNYTTVVDCSRLGGKFRWPQPQRLRGLNASDNDLSTLKNAYLPDSLEWLDLRYNNISRLDSEELVVLFETSRHLWLAGNPIICDCKNRQMLEALQKNKFQIVDYKELKCEGKRPLPLVKDVYVFELCKSGYSDTDLSDTRLGIPEQRLERKIFCSGPLESERPFSTTKTFNTISLYNCIISRTPMADVLKSLNINYKYIETMRLINVKFPQLLPRTYSGGLGLRNLELINIPNVPFGLFSFLGTLRRLTVENMVVPRLPPPQVAAIFEMILKNSSIVAWDNCIHLQNLTINGLTKMQISKSWPDECAGLRYLLLENMSPEAVQHAVETFNGTSLRELLVQHCSLVEVPLRLMQHLERLNILDLSYNDLEDHAFSQFPDVIKLRTLNLAHNKLKGEFLIDVIPKVPKLRELLLDGNNFVHIFQNFDIKTAITSLSSLERLSLNDMTFDADCLMNSNFNKLMFLELQSKEKEKVLLKLYGLPKTGAEQLTVDLTGRSFRSVQVEPEFFEDFEDRNTADFWITNKGYNLIVKMDYVDCVCNNDVLSRALSDFSRFLSMPGLRCDSRTGGLFVDEPLDKLNCLKATVHGCKRRISRNYKYTTTVDCSYNKQPFRWPRPEHHYISLNASGNNITSLRNAFLPETLQKLDLRNNLISRLDGNHSASLFPTSTRRVWLSGNPIACQCDNLLFLNALRTNHSQIVDYDEVTCADTGQPLRLVFIDELCRFKMEYVWGSLIALAVVALVAALLLRHFWISLRIYLYSRGLCMSCLREKDMDEDRPYDAFVSFAHGDDEYVMEQLLPQLEGEPNFYRVCVHYRDWAVGEWIPAQIMQSVRLSKRTIIVLSKNFITSWWGSMEFRYALASAESEVPSRLLILILDDVLSENLAPELQNYLNLNTYLRCDDPWFWGKLRFAMPRTQRGPEKGQAYTVNDPSDVMPMEALQPRNNSNQSVPLIARDISENRTNELRTV